MEPIIKKTRAYVSLQNTLSDTYNSTLKEYFTKNKDLTNSEYEAFFSRLRNADFRTSHNKLFTVQVEDLNVSGRFSYKKTDLKKQNILINPNSNLYHNDLKKALNLYTMYHEQAHEFQMDRIIDYARYKSEIDSDIDKIMYICMHYTELHKIHHDFCLHELLAHFEAIKMYFGLMLNNGPIPATFENLFVLNYEIVGLLKNFNLINRSESFPADFSNDSKNLITLYKNKFKNVQIKKHLLGIWEDDLLDIEFGQINYDIAQNTINEMLIELNEIFNQAFNMFLNVYEPSPIFKSIARLQNMEEIKNCFNSYEKYTISEAIIQDSFRITNERESKIAREKIMKLYGNAIKNKEIID